MSHPFLSKLRRVFSLFSRTPKDQSWFNNPAFQTKDPAYTQLVANPQVMAGYRLRNRSVARVARIPNVLDPTAPSLQMPEGPVSIVCAARDLLESVDPGTPKGPTFMDQLNEAAKDGRPVWVAGAGHYAVMNGTLERADVAVTNGSVANSHTKAFSKPRDGITYLVADTCFSNDQEDGKGGHNGPTLPHLINNLQNPVDSIMTFSPLALDYDGLDKSYSHVIGTGTGAPPACVALAAALRSKQGMGPADFVLHGFSGTSNFLPNVKEELPQDYLDRLKKDEILVRIDGAVFQGQKTFLHQTMEIVQMAHNYPDLIRSVCVDNPASFNARVFNVDGLPRTDFEIWDGQEWKPVFETGDDRNIQPALSV